MLGQEPTLFGEAAKEYVHLKWMEFYFEVVLVIAVLVIVVILLKKLKDED